MGSTPAFIKPHHFPDRHNFAKQVYLHIIILAYLQYIRFSMHERLQAGASLMGGGGSHTPKIFKNRGNSGKLRENSGKLRENSGKLRETKGLRQRSFGTSKKRNSKLI